MSLLGLSYEHTDEEEENETNEGAGSSLLVAYDHEEEEKEVQDSNGSATPTKRRRIDDGNQLNDNLSVKAESTEGAVEALHREEEEREEEMTEKMDEESRTDFEDQSSYLSDGRSLLDSMLPPRPSRPPDAALQGKIVQFHRLRREGRAKSINEKIRHARNFKNPYMLNWLVSHCGIDETGSNYPRELFDPDAIRRETVEVMERQKRQKQMAQPGARAAIEFTAAEGAAPASGPSQPLLPVPVPGMGVGVVPPRPIVKIVEGKKRNTKWDQGEPGLKPSGPAATIATATAPTTGSRYAEYALAKKAEIEARLRK
jgi:hypothetical protein